MKNLVLALFFLTFPAQAKLFESGYISFQLPPNWSCKIEGAERVCTSKFSAKEKEALIILTAKEMDPSDNLPEYTRYLKKARLLKTKDGSLKPSKFLRLEQRTINNATWVDGMHLGSESEYYYTRYLATVRKPLGILITFSAHKKHYTKYLNDFKKVIESIRIHVTKNFLDGHQNSLRGGSNETIGPPIAQQIPLTAEEDLPAEDTQSLNDLLLTLFAFLAIVGAAGFYFIRRKQKKNKSQ